MINMHLQLSTFSDPGQLRNYGSCYFKNVFPKNRTANFSITILVKSMQFNA